MSLIFAQNVCPNPPQTRRWPAGGAAVTGTELIASGCGDRGGLPIVVGGLVDTFTSEQLKRSQRISGRASFGLTLSFANADPAQSASESATPKTYFISIPFTLLERYKTIRRNIPCAFQQMLDQEKRCIIDQGSLLVTLSRRAVGLKVEMRAAGASNDTGQV